MNRKILPTIGQKFGNLSVMSSQTRRFNKETNFLCKCVCGNEKYYPSKALRAGRVRSCGCVRQKNFYEASRKWINERRLLKRDKESKKVIKISLKKKCNDIGVSYSSIRKSMNEGLSFENAIEKYNKYKEYVTVPTGARFGRLVIISDEYISKINSNGKRYRAWLCKCDCGNEKYISRKNLNNGSTLSCGCIRHLLPYKGRESIWDMENNPGVKRSYFSWNNMRERCYNSKAISYKYYGGRGIIVCDRWLESFNNFLEDMGERPINLTLERIDVNGNYELRNCKWATRKEQSLNRRSRGNRHEHSDLWE